MCQQSRGASPDNRCAQKVEMHLKITGVPQKQRCKLKITVVSKRCKLKITVVSKKVEVQAQNNRCVSKVEVQAQDNRCVKKVEVRAQDNRCVRKVEVHLKKTGVSKKQRCKVKVTDVSTTTKQRCKFYSVHKFLSDQIELCLGLKALIHFRTQSDDPSSWLCSDVF